MGLHGRVKLVVLNVLVLVCPRRMFQILANHWSFLNIQSSMKVPADSAAFPPRCNVLLLLHPLLPKQFFCTRMCLQNGRSSVSRARFSRSVNLLALPA